MVSSISKDKEKVLDFEVFTKDILGNKENTQEYLSSF